MICLHRERRHERKPDIPHPLSSVEQGESWKQVEQTCSSGLEAKAQGVHEEAEEGPLKGGMWLWKDPGTFSLLVPVVYLTLIYEDIIFIWNDFYFFVHFSHTWQ